MSYNLIKVRFLNTPEMKAWVDSEYDGVNEAHLDSDELTEEYTDANIDSVLAVLARTYDEDYENATSDNILTHINGTLGYSELRNFFKNFDELKKNIVSIDGYIFEEKETSKPSVECKKIGLNGLNHLSEITDISVQTLNNWFKDKPKLFKTVLIGAAEIAR